VCDKDDQAEQVILAKALVHVRLAKQDPLPAGISAAQVEAYKDDAIAGIVAAIGTDQACLENRTLAVGRNLPAYIWAAELLDLEREVYGPGFRSWLLAIQGRVYDGRTLRGTHEERPNNWGTNAGVARMSIALYLGQGGELGLARDVLHGYLGDRDAYAGFSFNDDVSWQPDPLTPVPINPLGAVRNGLDVDGVLGDEQRRVCDDCDACGNCSLRTDCDCATYDECKVCRNDNSFKLWTLSGGGLPPDTNYAWEALQGLIAQMLLVQNSGTAGVADWEDRALERALDWLHDVAQYPAEGDDVGAVWIANDLLGTSYPTASPIEPGKVYCCTDWLFGSP
jgi:hypothetical protein